MKAVDLKEKLHHVIDSAEPELLEILNSIAEKFRKNEEGLNPAQLEELKSRLEQFDSGKMKFFSWDEMMTQVKK